MSTFTSLTRAQWKGFVRDKQTLFWTVAFPLMFLVLFGFLMRDVKTPQTSLVVVGNVPIVQQLPPEAKAV